MRSLIHALSFASVIILGATAAPSSGIEAEADALWTLCAGTDRAATWQESLAACERLAVDERQSEQSRANAFYNAASLYRQKKDLARSRERMVQALRLKPDDAQILINIATIDRDTGNLVGARDAYSRAIKLQPNDEGLYYNRGNIHKSLGDLDSAIADYTTTIALSPKSADALNNRGTAYLKMGKKQSALADFNQALLVQAPTALRLTNRAGYWLAVGDLDAALNDINAALALDAEFGDAYAARGHIHLSRFNLLKSRTDYAMAQRFGGLEPDTSSGACLLGGLIGDAVTAADAACTRAESFGGSYEATLGRGLLLLRAGQSEKAIEAFDRSIELFPDNPIAVVGRAFADQMRGDSVRSRNDLADVRRKYPGLVERLATFGLKSKVR